MSTDENGASTAPGVRIVWSDREDLSAAARCVGELLDRSTPDGYDDCSTNSELAKGVGKSVSWVRQGLRELEALGMIRAARDEKFLSRRRVSLLWRTAPEAAPAEPKPPATIRLDGDNNGGPWFVWQTSGEFGRVEFFVVNELWTSRRPSQHTTKNSQFATKEAAVAWAGMLNRLDVKLNLVREVLLADMTKPDGCRRLDYALNVLLANNPDHCRPF